MKKPELLAPAGSFEKTKTAFLYGADAVYAGTSSLSLRTRAEMQDNDLEKTINYAHSIGKKVYTAINIYAWDENYEEIVNQARMLEKLKVDAVIVADGGIIEIIKNTSLINKLKKLLKPIMKILFPNIKKEDKEYDEISMNIVANLLGIGNAATPLGIKAMQTMQEKNKENPTKIIIPVWIATICAAVSGITLTKLLLKINRR